MEFVDTAALGELPTARRSPWIFVDRLRSLDARLVR